MPATTAREDSDVSMTDPTRRVALAALFFGILAIAAGYAAAFSKHGTPPWAAWMLAVGIPVSVGAIMILGAARGKRGIGALKFPFIFVIAILAIGFCAALAMPIAESARSHLWLGLPARAAVIIYVIGLLPIVVLPVAYAITFRTQTLTAEDVARVRALGERYRAESDARSSSETRAEGKVGA